MKPDTEMMSYQNPSIMDKDKTVVPVVVTTITPPTTTTTSIHRSKWIMVAVVAGMMLLVAVGAVMMQDGSYYHSSGSIKTEDVGITTAVEGLVLVGTQGKKTAAMTTTTTTTPTPTLQTFIAQYPELIDSSPKEQDFQYQAYLLYLSGMTLEELDVYYNNRGETRFFGRCCMDGQSVDGRFPGSPGCYLQRIESRRKSDTIKTNKGSKGGGGTIKTNKGSKGGGGYYGGGATFTCRAHVGNVCSRHGINRICCRTSPNSRVGRRRFVIGPCRN